MESFVPSASTASAGEPLVSVRDLSVFFDHGKHFVRVLHKLSFDVARGEALGIVGESGCGKSVTWMAILRLLDRRARIEGQVMLDGKEILALPEEQFSKIRGKRIAMIFQDPSASLNPVMKIGAQLAEAVTLHQGLRGAAARAEARRLLDRVQIANAAQRIDAYPHEMSGGMNQRAMIAMALACQPDLLVADEPTTALDVTIQAQIVELLNELRQESGMSLVMISHDLGLISSVADRVMVMYAGRVFEAADTDALFRAPLHPYTQGLLASVPDLVREQAGRLRTIPGSVPRPGELLDCCSFHPRCVRAVERCTEAVPPLREALKAHHVACVHV